MTTPDEEGRCPLHPAMQLRAIKKNGEWRTLMSACPLCISGFPATEDEYVKSEENAAAATSRPSSRPRSTSRHKKRGDGLERHVPPGTSPPSPSFNEEKKQERAFAKSSPSAVVLSMDNSFDSGEGTDEDDNYNDKIFDEFRNFLHVDELKNVVPISTTTSNSPTPSRASWPSLPKNGQPPLTMAPQALHPRQPPPPPYQSNTNKQGVHPQPIGQYPPKKCTNTPTIHHHRSHPVPPMKQRHESQPAPIKRPDPESICHQGPFHQSQQQQQQQQHHSPYEYPSSRQQPPTAHTPPYTEITEGYQQPPPEQEDVDAVSMNSVVYASNNLARSQSSNESYNSANLVRDGQSSNELYKLNNLVVRIESRSSSSSDDDDDNDSTSSSEGRTRNISKGIPSDVFDAKGKCVRHPTVRLRKKKLFGGWTVVLSNCPECCLDEMRRVKEERTGGSRRGGGSKARGDGESKSGNSRGSRKSKSSASKSSGVKKKKKKGKREKQKQRQRRELKDPPMSQVNFSAAGGGEDDKSIGTASTITISSYTLSSSGGGRGTDKNWREFASNDEDDDEDDDDDAEEEEEEAPRPAPARVTRMPYSDPNGERGWYTGSVDGTTGTPHGFGTMNFSNGAVIEGRWRDGVSVPPSPREMGASPINKVRYHPQGPTRRFALGHPPPPRSPLETHYEEEGRSRSRSGSRSNPRSRQQPQPPPQQMKSKTRKVVCGMYWTHANGSGAYTGEVNGRNIPDGVGSMRYNSGMVAEGLWRDGEMEEDVSEDNHGGMSYHRGNGGLDGFVGKNNVMLRGNGSSASVM